MYFSAISRCFASAGKIVERYCGPRSGPLPVQLRRVVRDREIDLQQLAVSDLRRVVGDLHRLGVARRAAADRLVVRRLLLAARVARDGFQHALDALEYALHAPEAAPRERRPSPSRRSTASRRTQAPESRPPSPRPARSRPMSRARSPANAHTDVETRKLMCRSFCCWPCPSSAERERVADYAGIQELDLERAVANVAGLADQLIEALFRHRAVAVRIDVGAMIAARRRRRRAARGSGRACRPGWARARGAGRGPGSGTRCAPARAFARRVLLAHRPLPPSAHSFSESFGGTV